MINKRLFKDLKKQLKNGGMESPESIKHCSLKEIDKNLLGQVSGGFGKQVGFGKFTSFSEAIG